MSDNVEPQARLIASLAETMRDRMGASDLLDRCRQMRDAIEEIERIARGRESGER